MSVRVFIMTDPVDFIELDSSSSLRGRICCLDQHNSSQYLCGVDSCLGRVELDSFKQQEINAVVSNPDSPEQEGLVSRKGLHGIQQLCRRSGAGRACNLAAPSKHFAHDLKDPQHYNGQNRDYHVRADRVSSMHPLRREFCNGLQPILGSFSEGSSNLCAGQYYGVVHNCLAARPCVWWCV